MRLKTTTVGLAIPAFVVSVLLASAAPSFAAPSEAEPGAQTRSVEKVRGEGAAKDPAEQELEGWAGTLISTICVFVGLVIVLRLTAWKPIMAGLKSREQAIRDSIEAAQKAKADAERSTRELQAKMSQVQQEAAQQLTQAKADAVKIADSIRAQAETESAALKDRTLREIEAAKQQALSEINTHAATLGTAVARKILQRQVNADDQQRLVDESLAELAKKN